MKKGVERGVLNPTKGSREFMATFLWTDTKIQWGNLTTYTYIPYFPLFNGLSQVGAPDGVIFLYGALKADGTLLTFMTL